MPSQKSTAARAVPIEPKRQRGHARVAVIMDAGAAVFAARGYDAATMTEIAAAARTAIGSLYRFFPTKAALADALLARFGERMGAALDAIAEAAPGLPLRAVSDQLVDMMLDLAADRALAIALMDSAGGGSEVRRTWRVASHARLAAVLQAIGVEPAMAALATPIVLRVIKIGPALAEEEGEVRAALVAEGRRLLTLYLTDLAGAQSTGRPFST